MQQQLQEKNKQTFENDVIRVEYRREPGCKVYMDVFVQPIAVKAAHERAVKTVGKEVSIPGFRKGKAPTSIILKNYAKEIDREARKVFLETAFQDSIQLANSFPISQQAVKRADMKKYSLDTGAEIHFEYIADPIIPEIDLSSVTVKLVAPAAITTDDVEAKLEEIQLERATFEEITDRPVAEGDYVEIDLDLIEHPARNLFTNRRFRVSKDDMPLWAFNLVLGMLPNEAREAQVSQNDLEIETCSADHEHTVACTHDHSKPMLCRVLLVSIQRGILPELNDEFATTCQSSSMEEMRTQITKGLEEEARKKANEETRNQLLTDLFEQYPIDLPDLLIEGEIQTRFEFVKSALAHERGSLPMTMDERENDRKIRGMLRGISYKFLSANYLLSHFRECKNMSITISQDELFHEMMLEQYFMPLEQRIIFPNTMREEDMRNRLIARILMRKTLDNCIAMAGQK